MKRFLQHISILFTLCVVLSACETDVEFGREHMENFPVLNSVVTADEPVRVYFSRSVFILDDRESTYVVDATVELNINDTYIESLRLESGEMWDGEVIYYYQSSTAPKMGDRVTIRARSEEFPEWVSGTTVIPDGPAVSGLEMSVSGVTDRRLRGKAHIVLSDPEEESNYYWVCGKLYDTQPDPDNHYISTPYEFLTYSDVAFSGGANTDILEELLGEGSGDTIIFDDSLIDGTREYQLKMEWAASEWWANESSDVYLEVMCQEIDEHLYKYYRSMELADSASLFGEPVQIYTNVVGGLGVIGSQSKVQTFTKYHTGGAQ